MKRIISLLSLLAVVAAAATPAALAAQKRTVKRKPALQRKAQSTRRAATKSNTAHSNRVYSRPRAEVIGPVFATYTVPQNQYFRLRMNQTLSSETARMGERFKATVVTPVYAGGAEVVPAGAIVEGRITSVQPARTRGREGQLALAFDALVLPDGTRRSIDGVLTELQGEEAGEVDGENEVSGQSSTKRKIAYIGGGGAGGAVLGGAIGGAKGAAIGAVIGAGAGVAGTLLTKGNEAEIRSGTEIGMVSTRPIVLSLRVDR